MKPALTLSFGTFLRFVIPGFILALATYPLIVFLLDKSHLNYSNGYIFAALVALCGLLVVMCDMQIYMFLEGRRYWPASIWRFLVAQQQKSVARLLTIEEKTHRAYKGRGDRWDELRYLEASVELRQFPLVEGEPRAQWPTRLGNIINAYEEYSERIYGLDCSFFWPRLWLVLDEKIRAEIDDRQALVDSAVYLCLSLGLSAVVFATYALVESCGVAIIPQVDASSWTWLGIASALLTYAVYRLSLHAHAQFGEMWKAIFDVYHDKIDLKVDDTLKEWTHEDILEKVEPRIRNKIIWRFLHNYMIKCRSTGEIFKPHEYKRRMERKDK